mmetsp:Transcript_53209/g.129212  ORF Transcript_53209/g.129212 Transcript_53209/m.129212 type:complete len:200 (-) Transcript_53209:850-1449(-)
MPNANVASSSCNVSVMGMTRVGCPNITRRWFKDGNAVSWMNVPPRPLVPPPFSPPGPAGRTNGPGCRSTARFCTGVRLLLLPPPVGLPVVAVVSSCPPTAPEDDDDDDLVFRLYNSAPDTRAMAQTTLRASSGRSNKGTTTVDSVNRTCFFNIDVILAAWPRQLCRDNVDVDGRTINTTRSGDCEDDDAYCASAPRAIM